MHEYDDGDDGTDNDRYDDDGGDDDRSYVLMMIIIIPKNMNRVTIVHNAFSLKGI